MAMSLASKIEAIAANDASIIELNLANDPIGDVNHKALIEALKGNTTVKKISLERTGLTDEIGALWGPLIASTTSIEDLDLGYNKVAAGMAQIGEGLKTNKSITQIKLHRQDKDMGSAVEAVFAEFWAVNTTLKGCYVTLHDRTCNQKNTRGEIRNKEIGCRIRDGRSYEDLDPATCDEWAKKQKLKREQEAAEAVAANAPITSKVPSTGGPYTYKQLTCPAEFRPDDVDVMDRPKFLADDEFVSIFNIPREEFAALPKWKANGKKKDVQLH